MLTRAIPTPDEVQRALEAGEELPETYLQALLQIDAQALGLSLDEARVRAKHGTLPRNPIADDFVALLNLERS